MQAEKIRQLIKSLRYGESSDGKYPVFNREGDMMYELSLVELIARAVGPRTKVGAEEYLKWRRKIETNREYDKIREEVIEAIADGDGEKLADLLEEAQKHDRMLPVLQGIYGDDALQHELERRNLPSGLRDLMQVDGRFLYRQMQERGR